MGAIQPPRHLSPGIRPKSEPASPTNVTSPPQRVASRLPEIGAGELSKPPASMPARSQALPTWPNAADNVSGIKSTAAQSQEKPVKHPRTRKHSPGKVAAGGVCSSHQGQGGAHADDGDQQPIQREMQRVLQLKQLQHQSKKPTRHLSQAGRLWQGSLPVATAPVATNNSASVGAADAAPGGGVVDLTRDDMLQRPAESLGTRDPQEFASTTDARGAGGLQHQYHPASPGPPRHAPAPSAAASLATLQPSSVPRSSGDARAELPSMAAELAQMVAKDRAKDQAKNAAPAARAALAVHAAPAGAAAPSAAVPAAPGTLEPPAVAAPQGLPARGSFRCSGRPSCRGGRLHSQHQQQGQASASSRPRPPRTRGDLHLRQRYVPSLPPCT